MRTTRLTIAIAALAVLLLDALPAQAQAIRTWVSGMGDDANPCSRTSPCKTFPGAISKTARGGAISVLDRGGFGWVIITKSISVISEVADGGILADGSNGITINAGPADVVYLEGLIIEGGETGLVGVRVLAGGSVHIRKSVIRGFRGKPGLGIEIVPTTATHVVVSDRVLVENNPGGGIRADSKAASIRLNQSAVTGNGTGLEVASGGTIMSFGNNAIS